MILVIMMLLIRKKKKKIDRNKKTKNNHMDKLRNKDPRILLMKLWFKALAMIIKILIEVIKPAER